MFRDGHELIRAVVRYRGPDGEQWQEAGLHRIDAHLGGVRWAGQFTVDRPGALAVHDRGVDRRVRDLARRAAAQGRRRPARPRGELSEGVVLLRGGGRARPAIPPTRALIEHAVAAARGPRRARVSAKHDVALGEELPAP